MIGVPNFKKVTWPWPHPFHHWVRNLLRITYLLSNVKSLFHRLRSLEGDANCRKRTALDSGVTTGRGKPNSCGGAVAPTP